MAGRFADRFDAGRALAGRLAPYAGRPDVIVLALPRGGVPVGYEVARALGVPLDVFSVRKLGVPGHEELAMGAIATGGVIVLNQEVVQELGIPRQTIDAAVEVARHELTRREITYRGQRPPPDVAGKVVILVDDGLATGSTMRAAVAALQGHNPAWVVVAAPVAAAEVCRQFEDEVDQIVCILTPPVFYAVGLWYEDFSQIPDEEVRDLIEQANSPRP